MVLPPKRLSPVASVAAAQLDVATLANMAKGIEDVTIRQQAMRILADRLQADLDVALLVSIEHQLGRPLVASEELAGGRLQVVNYEGWDTYSLDGKPLLRVGRADVVQHGDDLRAHRSIEILNGAKMPQPPASPPAS